ncbi:flavodoxin reductase family protein [secondary endosymbiont of Heteropsylla cubana]|uniref:Flavodoxin/ferredoxin--NADP reductase n=1 Tax=secondary endosymbiont of Heteropsylla cubana TaxID=134287 RepID=J3TGI9_9ENTR|nr:ferredoxin--NADP(+) reductase [secondary endosymbiont of Heteropsylla cubana]AFP85562.1 flavodoxin reductase family protein [secondary endosymbiont of Heteropsylla cubana]
MEKWVTGHLIEIKHWTENLFTLIVQAPIDPFIAGQFAKLGLEIQGQRIQRAYSYVNAPNNNNLEFYLVSVPNGKLSPLLHLLKSGDTLIITKQARGSFVLDQIPPSCKYLWMLATGTALGPYLSILQHGEELTKFTKIILVHAVRFAKDMSYLPKMIDLVHIFGGKLKIQTIVSRESSLGSLTGRIPALIADGSLEAAVGVKLNVKDTHVMLCGNPCMVRETQQVLQEKLGMCKHFKEKPGNIFSENYW